jgi:hypothetical protein
MSDIENIIYAVFDGEYDNRGNALITTDQVAAINKFLESQESPFIEAWCNNELLGYYPNKFTDPKATYQDIENGIRKILEG